MSRKIKHLQAHLCKWSCPQKKVLKFLQGGEGVGRSVKVVGASATPKKRKWKKGEESTIRYEKKGVGGSHEAESGRNPTTKNSQRS
jgi:hypothetical protein